jgi:hypothetical protein
MIPTTAVPRNVDRKTGLSTATLMACIARFPSAGGKRESAVITKEEKAKKSPPIRPVPRMATEMRRGRCCWSILL